VLLCDWNPGCALQYHMEKKSRTGWGKGFLAGGFLLHPLEL
jgi:hypothetical protein